MRDKAHVEGLHQAEELGADVPDAKRSERAADKPDAHVLAAAGEARGSFAGQAVLGHELAGQREHQGDDRHRHRTADAVGRDDEGDAGLGARLDVDGVVADTEARDDRKPAVRMDAGALEPRGEKDQGIKFRHLVDADRIARLEEFHLDAGCALQRGEVEIGIDGRAVRLAEVARKRDAKRGGHFLLLAFLGLQPARSRSIASASALCRTQTSPE